MDEMSAQCSWPDLVYRLVEHYKWEPQHLRGTKAEFDERIRRQEVPLNFLFSVLLRVCSTETMSALLQEFGIGRLQEQFRLEFPIDAGFTQPDIIIESPNSRIFIEAKVDAAITTKQVQKYLFLHASMDGIGAKKKQPYLLFLTMRQFQKCWRPRTEASGTNDVQAFLADRIFSFQVDEKLKQVAQRPGLIAAYETIKQNVRYGAATWESIRYRLSAAADQFRRLGSHVTETRIIDDFLHDLKCRVS